MASTKPDFTKSPTAAFLSEETKEAKAPKAPAKRQKKKDAIPFGYSIKADPKTERLALLIKKVTKDCLLKEAEETGQSLNETVNMILESYFAEKERG